MRLLVVSNRLPITAQEKDGEFRFHKSVGGLATGLSSFLKTLPAQSNEINDYLWIGWPGLWVEPAQQENFRQQMLAKAKSYPVFLTDESLDKFYHGFCNKTLWPLFHFFTNYTGLEQKHWEEYKRVNQQYCKTLLDILKPDDIVWIHDYQLMLLPQLIRKARPEITIGFFLHIPFPPFEIFRFLPIQWRQTLLSGLLGADLLGFHTHDYTQAFLRCVLRILGPEHNMGQIIFDNRVVKADTFPMGIDFEAFHNAVSSVEVLAEEEKLKTSFQNLKVVLSVDRLDYTKGILNRLQGYELFLEKNQPWLKKVVLVLVLVPSRVRVDHYQKMKRQIDEYIGKINGRFGSLDWTPIIYQYRTLTSSPLIALYHSSDVALVTPLRDGMNLIAKEYLACRTDGTGVLILSEMAGASQELGEALIINPNSKEEIAEALKAALEMPASEQIHRNRVMQARLKQYNIIRWAHDFMHELFETKTLEKKFRTKLMVPALQQELVKKFQGAKHRLLLLDYDGTLVSFNPSPELAIPSETLLTLLQRLSDHPSTDLVIVSGRNKSILQKWFQNAGIHLVAEHGAWIRNQNTDWKTIKPLRDDWKPQILSILRTCSDRLPGSFVEEKEYSVVWHYRKADPELASLRKKELMDDLVNFTATIEVQVVPGNKIVEVRNAGLSKGLAAMEFISRHPFDFVLAIGDDQTDEDLFHALPESAYSIRVGISNSFAKFNLPSHHEVLQLLESLTC
ncbi:MAG: bifunctional alpha,alpha-trehalose-phosphate synthase (UDP-forming)/trehalose-phosphatase [Deltaproteobacteria bacterium]|nr:bifunctional alpha,alpha-trehalose-phosphate synthase (UDP-forming)/trehalose-phosphatase [Deltaproteobacteria bacterium]